MVGLFWCDLSAHMTSDNDPHREYSDFSKLLEHILVTHGRGRIFFVFRFLHFHTDASLPNIVIFIRSGSQPWWLGHFVAIPVCT